MAYGRTNRVNPYVQAGRVGRMNAGIHTFSGWGLAGPGTDGLRKGCTMAGAYDASGIGSALGARQPEAMWDTSGPSACPDLVGYQGDPKLARGFEIGAGYRAGAVGAGKHGPQPVCAGFVGELDRWITDD